MGVDYVDMEFEGVEWTRELVERMVRAYAKLAGTIPTPKTPQEADAFVAALAKEAGVSVKNAASFCVQLGEQVDREDMRSAFPIDGLSRVGRIKDRALPARRTPARIEVIDAGLKTGLKALARRIREGRKLRADHQLLLHKMTVITNMSYDTLLDALARAADGEIEELVEATCSMDVVAAIDRRIATLRAESGNNEAEIARLMKTRRELVK